MIIVSKVFAFGEEPYKNLLTLREIRCFNLVGAQASHPSAKRLDGASAHYRRGIISLLATPCGDTRKLNLLKLLPPLHEYCSQCSKSFSRFWRRSAAADNFEDYHCASVDFSAQQPIPLGYRLIRSTTQKTSNCQVVICMLFSDMKQQIDI